MPDKNSSNPKLKSKVIAKSNQSTATGTKTNTNTNTQAPAQKQSQSGGTSTSTKVTIVGMEGCQHCSDAKEFLEKHGVKYEYVDALDPRNAKLVKDDEVVPKICLSGKTNACVIGFDKRKLTKLLGLKK